VSVRLNVANLSPKTGREALRELFAEDGRIVVEVRLVTDRHGRSRGSAIVELGDGVDVAEVLLATDGVEIDGHSIRVTRADDDESDVLPGAAREFEDDDEEDRRGRARLGRTRDE
jgi:RNA recognition motif-containing protein